MQGYISLHAKDIQILFLLKEMCLFNMTQLLKTNRASLVKNWSSLQQFNAKNWYDFFALFRKKQKI
ncbi:MAG: hypothetical protein JWQ38_1838 [Flavipsychrobacter sp.]|nr:hypothetical protein [Flavipsychrobacter sp.]